MKGMKFADVLGGALSAGPVDSRRAHLQTLKDVLKLSDVEAERVATAVKALCCGEYDDDEMEEEGSEKPPSISIVFGKQRKE